MKLIRDLKTFKATQGTIVAIGNFDAMHCGHQWLLEKLTSEAKQLALCPTVITFEPLPPEFFSADPPARLSSLREKYQFLKKAGVKLLVCLRFNRQLAQLAATDFVEQILVKKLQMRHLIVGEDFRFGHQRQGNIELLQQLGKQHGFTVEVLPAVAKDSQRVSSTLIRQYLAAGNLKLVEALLNRPFSLSGRVSYGNQRGQQLGFPTANIHLRRKKVPVQGVFVVRVHGAAEKPVFGVANVGNRPTVDGISHPRIEVFLLDFNDNIYGRFLKVEFLEKLRDEKRFGSLEELTKQIKEDVEAGLGFLKNLKI